VRYRYRSRDTVHPLLFTSKKKYNNQNVRTSVSVSDPDLFRILSGQLIRIRIRNQDPNPGGQKLPTKLGKNYDILCFEVLDVLFLALKASSVTWKSFMEA
jgi:hypothetical protein